mmetsp:Transcript_12973/g.32789  ORF Transcript_12973/g.32789 Transcript_12973/m.32789 type:complete len:207 (+) Transcript_12973:145-765(+)
MVARWTSSGPSATRRVLRADQRWGRMVTREDIPAAPCTCIAKSTASKHTFGVCTLAWASAMRTYRWLVGLKERPIALAPLPILPPLRPIAIICIICVIRSPSSSLWSSIWAALRTRSRAWSRPSRISASLWRKPPCLAMFDPKTRRASARWTARLSARSAMPIARVQWCRRPGPRRDWATSKPLPGLWTRFDDGTTTLSKVTSAWP